MQYIIIILSIIIVILIFLCLKHNKKEKQQLKEIQQKLSAAKTNLIQAEAAVKRAEDADKRYALLIQKYQRAVKENQTFFTTQKQTRQRQLEEQISKKRAMEQMHLSLQQQIYNEQIQEAKLQLQQKIKQFTQQEKQEEQKIIFAKEKVESLIAPLQQYQKQQQEKFFYTIQIPQEFRDDIDFLLIEVSKKVKHPDVINKLVWTQYVKPYIEATFKRVGIKSQPGIYKITNINDSKSYIGKSTDIKKRIAQHFKSAVGISNIASQYVHKMILQQGLWNWMIEPIIYCDKQKLSEMEKFYIDFFKTQEYGYNRKEGG